MRSAILLFSALSSFCYAVPTPTQPAELEDRDIIGGMLSSAVSNLNAAVTQNIVSEVVAGINSAVNPTATSNIFKNILTDIKLATATSNPTNVAQASSALFSIHNTRPSPTAVADVFNTLAQLVGAGLTTQNFNDFENFLEGVVDGANSFNNINLANPTEIIYPRADYRDAPYSLYEFQLRAAIHIPPTFKYGFGPQPIILVPGTGDSGYTTFVGNLIPLLQNSKIADPVWLNIPGYLLGDAQQSAEYVAYAINYIYSITGCRPIAVAAWSQGNINSQWAYKYWPSTRARVADHIAFSPDYHGTVLANDIATPDLPLPPSLLQQEFTSRYISTMRASGGDSAYVPTTTIYSGFFDEIVEPQQGTGASAYLLDARRKGVSNNEVQTVCKDQPAGTFYTHEGTLYNPLGFALLKDALAHPGPGQPSRLNLAQVCSTYLTPGLDLADFLLTENSIAIAGFQILTYPYLSTVEMAIKCTLLISNYLA